MALQGTFTALITPFKEDESIDWEALKKLIQFQIDGKVDGLVPCGTTGESPTLNHKEHREVIEFTTKEAKKINPDIKIIAGTGSNSTSEAIALTEYAASVGADYALVVNPYYNKPTQAGLIQHFTAIADKSDIPLVLYNIPGRTAIKLSVETIQTLSKHKNIVAVKEATGDLNFMTQVILATDDDFTVLSGDDNLTLPLLSVGGRGTVSVIANIFPQETSDITRKFLANDYVGAKESFLKLFPLCKAMFLETNPIPVKYAAYKRGLCADVLRLPMTTLTDINRTILDKAISDFKN